MITSLHQKLGKGYQAGIHVPFCMEKRSSPEALIRPMIILPIQIKRGLILSFRNHPIKEAAPRTTAKANQ